VRLEQSPDILPGFEKSKLPKALLKSRHVACEDPAAAKVYFEGRGTIFDEEEGRRTGPRYQAMWSHIKELNNLEPWRV
jgi:hypothetical protein